MNEAVLEHSGKGNSQRSLLSPPGCLQHGPLSTRSVQIYRQLAMTTYEWLLQRLWFIPGSLFSSPSSILPEYKRGRSTSLYKALIICEWLTTNWSGPLSLYKALIIWEWLTTNWWTAASFYSCTVLSKLASWNCRPQIVMNVFMFTPLHPPTPNPTSPSEIVIWEYERWRVINQRGRGAVC